MGNFFLFARHERNQGTLAIMLWSKFILNTIHPNAIPNNETTRIFLANSSKLRNNIAGTLWNCTCHGFKQLVGFEVSEGGEAAGAPEGSAVGRVSLVGLDAPPHVIQFVLDHIDQHPRKLGLTKKKKTLFRAKYWCNFDACDKRKRKTGLHWRKIKHLTEWRAYCMYFLLLLGGLNVIK